MTGALQLNCPRDIEFMSIRRTYVFRIRKSPLAYSICEWCRLGYALAWRPHDSIKMFSCRDTHKRRKSTKRRVITPTLHGHSRIPCVSKTNKSSSGPILRDIDLNFDISTHKAILNNRTKYHKSTYRLSCTWLFHPTLHMSESNQLEDIDMQLPPIDPHWPDKKQKEMPLPYLGSTVSEIFHFFWFLLIFHNSYIYDTFSTKNMCSLRNEISNMTRQLWLRENQ